MPAAQWEMLSKSLKTKSREQLKEALQQFSNDAQDADRFDLARAALEALTPLVEPAEAKRVAARLKELDAAAASYDQVKQALATLATNPADPAANRIAGQYVALVKLDWAKGLPLLSRSDDPVLKALAKREFTQPDAPREQVKLGDAWWDYAKGQKDETFQAGANSRARFWYQLALPELSGADRQRVEARTSLEGRMHRAHDSENEVKLSHELLASKLHAEATYDAETNRLTLIYDLGSDSQLKDFSGDAHWAKGELTVSAGEALRHVVKFKTVKLTGVVAMKSEVGDVAKSSAGLVARRDGATVKVSVGSSSASSSENGPPGDELVLPFEVQSGEKLVVFRLADQVVGKAMAKSDVGQLQLCGGDAGATFSKLMISGQPDRLWLAKFFDLPPVAVDKSATPAKRKAAGKYGRVKQVVIWNEHNGPHHNCGTRTCNVLLQLGGKTVWKKTDVEVPWEPTPGPRWPSTCRKSWPTRSAWKSPPGTPPAVDWRKSRSRTKAATTWPRGRSSSPAPSIGPATRGLERCWSTATPIRRSTSSATGCCPRGRRVGPRFGSFRKKPRRRPTASQRWRRRASRRQFRLRRGANRTRPKLLPAATIDSKCGSMARPFCGARTGRRFDQRFVGHGRRRRR